LSAYISQMLVGGRSEVERVPSSRLIPDGGRLILEARPPPPETAPPAPLDDAVSKSDALGISKASDASLKKNVRGPESHLLGAKRRLGRAARPPYVDDGPAPWGVRFAARAPGL
jgi:hypothetical protein